MKNSDSSGVFLSGVLRIDEENEVSLLSFKASDASKADWNIYLQNEDRNEKLEKIGELYLRKGKKVDTFMAGYVDVDDDTRMQLVVFKNEFKKEDNHPDYRILASTQADGASFNDDVPF